MTKARTLADMISDGVIGTTELADDVITPVKLDETGSYVVSTMTANGGSGAVTLAANSDIRATTGNWTGEHSGKIQYHNNEWYFQFADKMIGRNGSAVNVFTVDSTGDGYFAGGMALGSTVADRALLNVNHHNTVSNGIFNNAHIALTFDTAPQDNDSIAAITFATSDNDNYGFSIGAKRSNGGAGDFLFNNHYNSATGTELMRLSAGGSLIIDGNNTDGSHKLQIGEYNTTGHSQSEGETKLIHIDDSYVMRVAREHNSGDIASTGWYSVAKIPSFGTSGKCTVSMGGDFTADVVEIDWISSVNTALNNSVSRPRLRASGTFAQVTTPRITRARIARATSDSQYYIQVYVASGVNNNTNGKSLLEVRVGDYVENSQGSIQAMFNAFSGTTTHDWTVDVIPNGVQQHGIHTKPEQPLCAFKSSVSTTNDQRYGVQNTILNQGSHLDTGSNSGRFTCPVAGNYKCTFTGYTNYTNGYGYLHLRKNGVTQGHAIHWNHNGNTIHTSVANTFVVNCAAGNYLEFWLVNANSRVQDANITFELIG